MWSCLGLTRSCCVRRLGRQAMRPLRTPPTRQRGVRCEPEQEIAHRARRHRCCFLRARTGARPPCGVEWTEIVQPRSLSFVEGEAPRNIPERGLLTSLTSARKIGGRVTKTQAKKRGIGRWIPRHGVDGLSGTPTGNHYPDIALGGGRIRRSASLARRRAGSNWRHSQLGRCLVR